MDRANHDARRRQNIFLRTSSTSEYFESIATLREGRQSSCHAADPARKHAKHSGISTFVSFEKDITEATK